MPKVIEGSLLAEKKRFAIIVSRFNERNDLLTILVVGNPQNRTITDAGESQQG